MTTGGAAARMPKISVTTAPTLYPAERAWRFDTANRTMEITSSTSAMTAQPNKNISKKVTNKTLIPAKTIILSLLFVCAAYPKGTKTEAAALRQLPKSVLFYSSGSISP